MTAAQVERLNNYDDVIRLQLKKPKGWHWQLTTSKSSPNITLPVINLYDRKGRLLLQTRDRGECQKKSWHSLRPQNEEASINVAKDLKNATTTHHLVRSTSAVVDQSFTLQQHKTPQSINKEQSLKHHCALSKSSSEFLGRKKRPDAENRKKTVRKYNENSINDIGGATEERPYYLRKSKSDVIEFKEAGYKKPRELFRENVTPTINETSIFPTTSHRRTQSNDVFRRKLKYNKEKWKNPEQDENKNLIDVKNLNLRLFPTDAHPNDQNAPSSSEREKSKKKKNMLKMTAECGSLANQADKAKVNHLKHTKYITRTSKAGTLIISEEESFNKSDTHRQHRRCDVIDENYSDEANDIRSFDLKQNSAGVAKFFDGIKADQTCMRPLERKNKERDDSFRTKVSVPFSIQTSNVADDKEISRNMMEELGVKRMTSPEYANLISNKTETFPSLPNNNYISQEITLLSNKGNKCVEARTHNQNEVNNESEDRNFLRKRCRKLRHSYSSDELLSSTPTPNADRKYRRKRKNFNTKVFVNKEPRKAGQQIEDRGGGGGGDLLNLVRRLSTSDHVIMGANVSRHSSKGLSGRRSQSSGSICNGKGRHNDEKICGSLPSYLDDRDANGCNNNHDCQKPPHDEVGRIPPMGDGAPLHWKFSETQTALCDQGYGSERSPEEEYPPPLPEHDIQCHHHLEPHACYPFITPESTFAVRLTKGSRGLGLSVTGGIDSGGSWPGLIRIKRLFPHQPASQCGLLNVGDLLLEANGITLTALTNYEALEVLRTAANQVELKVCRPPPDVLSCVSPISEVPPPPPRRERPPSVISLPPTAYSSPEDDYYHGGFEVTLTKIQGSLGFTLRKEDDSALGHYVRALVREPALTDGRIRAGDKIIAVNEVEISPMTHEQAVQFLRQCGDIVRLRLYRDSAQTPVATLSPTETTPRTSFSRKANLRQEAVDMLNDIAVRKLIPGNEDTSHHADRDDGDTYPQEPASMPHIPLDNAGFSYKNPAYQTAHPQCGADNEEKTATLKATKADDATNMKKWKGVVFEDQEEQHTKTSKVPKILAIELNRGWNSRLGFSLQGAAGVTYVSAVHDNSVASRDGRIKPGDRLIKVNDESVENMSTNEIIDLLRIVRGPVCIVVSRTNANEDCIKSNAVN